MDRQQARGNFNAYFQNDPVGHALTANRRVAICQVGLGGRNRVLRAISGTHYEPSVNPKVMAACERMLANYDATDHANKGVRVKQRCQDQGQTKVSGSGS